MLYRWLGTWVDTINKQPNKRAKAYILLDRSLQASSKQMAKLWLDGACLEIGARYELTRYSLISLREIAESLQAAILSGSYGPVKFI